MTSEAKSGTRLTKPGMIALTGPTGVGKSTVAQELALRLGASVLSADSMQIYRGMDIGTAKVPRDERRVPHYGIDLVEPLHAYSAAEYQVYGRDVIGRAVTGGGAPPIVCGGTGLYLRAVLDDFEFPGIVEDEETGRNEIRNRYQVYVDEHGEAALHTLLVQRDAESAALIHPNNVRRVIRALELAEAGERYAERSRAFGQRISCYPTTWIALTCERHELYRRIDLRVDAMMAAGLLDEVEQLLAAGYREALTAAQAIGYKELVPVIESGANLPEAIADIKQATRRYAKRQLSWLRSDPRVHWVEISSDLDSFTPAIDAIMELIMNGASGGEA